jgi:hypothetical protein
MNLKEFFFYKHPEYVLTDTFECGAIDYWANISKVNRNDEGMVVSFEVTSAEDDFEEVYFEEVYVVSFDTVRLGIARIFDEKFEIGKHIIKQFVEDDVDVEGCDCIIQAGLFGVLVYG